MEPKDQQSELLFKQLRELEQEKTDMKPGNLSPIEYRRRKTNLENKIEELKTTLRNKGHKVD